MTIREKEQERHVTRQIFLQAQPTFLKRVPRMGLEALVESNAFTEDTYNFM